jgi:hypothetical protein
MRVVFSIDLASTRVFGVRGELASLSGLKLMTALRMRLEVDGRVRTRIGRQFSVPSTMSASLRHGSLNQYGSHEAWSSRRTSIPAVVLKHGEHPVQETRGLCFELSRVEKWMAGWDHPQGDLKAIKTLLKISIHSNKSRL